ncbi:MAG: glycosyltransferase 2 family protein [Solirubrobacteraceae bacterium]|nr:glycosyltransferase 2 family protein [Solirubrobacteraceae bacterium]
MVTRESARARLGATVARLLPALRVVGFVAALGVVAAMAVGAARDVRLQELRWWLLVPAALAAVAWWLLLARGWALLVRGRATRPDVSTWCRTQALRYLPGGIWAPASRLVVVDGTALDRVSTVAAENVIALCAALAVGGPALALAGAPWWAALVVLAAAPVVAARLTAARSRVDPDRARRATVNDVAAFGAYAASAVLVQAAISGWHHPLAVAGAAAIAWSAGLVVVIAPSGIGVRELVYVALLAGVLPKTDAAAAAVTMRLVTIAAEAAVLVIAGRPAARTGA